MWWLWIVGPLAAALLFVLTDWKDRRRDDEVARWRREKVLPKGTKKAGPRVVAALPDGFDKLLEAVGGGKRTEVVQLVPKLAYLVFHHADAVSASDHQTIVAKLEEAGPAFLVRPPALLDGAREPNSGVQFKKDAEFMETFIVDRAVDGPEGITPGTEAGDKVIRKWLSPTVRAALVELPEAWLRVQGKIMAITLYGTVEAERIDELLTAADVIFAEYGAAGGPSLFGDEGDEPAEDEKAASAPVAKKKSDQKPSDQKPA
jgi:hypothetical protein